ncbi:MAG: methyltransferase [Pseudomonadales bacterium]|nr:methyltransferase [Pseudomonadales bacterium]
MLHPGVFPPAIDTKLLVANVEVSETDRIIDVTTGSGTSSILTGLQDATGLQGATGCAIDINPKAVENARQNIQQHDIDIKVMESDLFFNQQENYLW